VAAFPRGQSVPTLNQVLAAGQNLFLGQERDVEDIPLGLHTRQLLLNLVQPIPELLVANPEAFLVQNVRLVQLDQLVGFPSDLALLRFESRKEVFKALEPNVPRLHMLGNLGRREDERPEFRLENLLQVINRNLVAAGLADVLRRVRGHIHLGAALAEREPREQVHNLFGLPLTLDALLVEKHIDLAPQVLGDDGLDRCQHPGTLRLELPGAL